MRRTRPVVAWAANYQGGGEAAVPVGDPLSNWDAAVEAQAAGSIAATIGIGIKASRGGWLSRGCRTPMGARLMGEAVGFV